MSNKFHCIRKVTENEPVIELDIGPEKKFN